MQSHGLLALGLVAVGVLALPGCEVVPHVAASPQAPLSIEKPVAELKGSDSALDNHFGWSVAASGATAIVGSPRHADDVGAAYLFSRTATGWRRVAELRGAVTDEGFGYSVAVSGGTAVVGAPGDASFAGRAYVFTKTGALWKQVAALKGSDIVAGDFFGWSVAISGNTAVVGSYLHAKKAGRAYVFHKTTAGWKQAAELKGSDTVVGDEFGDSVAVSGTTAVVGSPGHAKKAGRAYVFAKTAAGWKQTAELKGADAVGRDAFGYAVAVSGKTTVVGAPGFAKSSGRAYVFAMTEGGWTQVGELKGSKVLMPYAFGCSVGTSGTAAIVGAENITGRAYVFTRHDAGWKQTAELEAGNGPYGRSVRRWLSRTQPRSLVRRRLAPI